MAASLSLFLAIFLVDQAPTLKARCASSRVSTYPLIERAGDRWWRPAAARSRGIGECATTATSAAVNASRTPPRCSRARSVSDPATAATKHCSSCSSSSAGLHSLTCSPRTTRIAPRSWRRAELPSSQPSSAWFPRLRTDRCPEPSKWRLASLVPRRLGRVTEHCRIS